jgi:restriction endonuclease S subunit
MVVEIKQTDTPEEVEKKLLAIREETEKKKIERKERIMKHFGSIKIDIDPLELQRQWRNEWD